MTDISAIGPKELSYFVWLHGKELKCYLPVVPLIMSNYQPSSIRALENCQAVAGAGRQRMAHIMPFPEKVIIFLTLVNLFTVSRIREIQTSPPCN